MTLPTVLTTDYTCGCGETLHMRCEDGQVRFQHGENPEHSIGGPMNATGEIENNPDVEITIEYEYAGYLVFGRPMVTVRGRWIDAVHSRMVMA